MPTSRAYAQVLLGQAYHKKDIVIGDIRICYHVKTRSYILPGGEIVDRNTAIRSAEKLAGQE